MRLPGTELNCQYAFVTTHSGSQTLYVSLSHWPVMTSRHMDLFACLFPRIDSNYLSY